MEKEQGGKKKPGEDSTPSTASRDFLKTTQLFFHFAPATNYAIRPGDNLLKGARFSLPEATALLYGLDIVLED